MSDTPTDTPDTAPEAAQEPTTFDADYVSKLRAEAAKYRKEAKANADAAARLAQIEESQKTEAQRAAEALAAAQREAEQARAEALRLKVGVAHGLPPELVSRLQGSTEEELAADAANLLPLIKPATPSPATAPQPAPVSGTVPPNEQQPTSGEQLFRQILNRQG